MESYAGTALVLSPTKASDIVTLCYYQGTNVDDGTQ